jgi:hypothetical protein
MEDAMARVNDYKLELGWLLILILLFACAPARSSATTEFSWDDVPDECGSGVGDCVIICCR